MTAHAVVGSVRDFVDKGAKEGGRAKRQSG